LLVLTRCPIEHLTFYVEHSPSFSSTKLAYACQNIASITHGMTSAPLKTFIIYAREDRDALLELKKHLVPLERRG
jgi:hypothetical protein